MTMNEQQEKLMVCNNCFRGYTAFSKSWLSAEKEPCPHCHSTNTTPVLEQRLNKRFRVCLTRLPER
jgi:Zn finger protein HypA/HybF involved in hydrogenase expression